LEAAEVEVKGRRKRRDWRKEELRAKLLAIEKTRLWKGETQAIAEARKEESESQKNKLEEEMRKEHSEKEQDKLRRDAIALSAAIYEKMGEEMSDAEYFAEITAKSNKMDQFKFEKFIKTLGVEIDHPSMVFKEACKFVGADCSVLDKDSFMALVANTYYFVMKPTTVKKEIGLHSQKVGDLEKNQVVQVLEGPVDVNGVIRVKIFFLKKDGSEAEGFATLRAAGIENLVRYCPPVWDETAPRDASFDSKGSKIHVGKVIMPPWAQPGQILLVQVRSGHAVEIEAPLGVQVGHEITFKFTIP